MSESLTTQDIPYDRRKRASEKLRTIMTGSNGSAYFNAVVRPNMLPEDIPTNLPNNVFWIGEKDMNSFTRSREAMGDLLRQMIDLGDMRVEDAVVCADSLSIDCFHDTALYTFPAPQHETAGQGMADTEAVILPFRQRPPIDPFGVANTVLDLSPKVSLYKRPEDGHHFAAVTPIRPEEPDAVILQFDTDRIA